MSVVDVSLARRQRRVGAVALLGIIVVLVGLAGRLVHIQLSLGPQLVKLAERQRQGRSMLPAYRGQILDARGRLVAVTRLVPDVFVDPALVDDIDSLSAELAARLNEEPDTIASKIRSRADKRYVRLASRVDAVTADAVRDLHHAAVGLERRPVRMYPLGMSMAHVLGFVGRDGAGLEGIERAYEKHLRGTDGRRATIRDARRRALWRTPGGLVEPIDGGHLVLTIDAEIQRITEESLGQAIDDFEAESGVAVVMSPLTGDVLAMACWPAFDPNHPGGSSSEDRRNRAVTDPIEPGSTFKPIIASGALDGGFVSRTEKIDCGSGVKRFGRRLVRDVSSNGVRDIKGIITKSSNVGMAIIADRMGNPALYRTVRGYGFGDLTGIGLPGESPGIVHPLSRWTRMSTTSISFGYEIGVTPLQLLTAFCAILNDGVLLKPRIVRARRAADGHVLEWFTGPQPVRRVISHETAQYLAFDVLPSVVEDGGGHRAQLDRYRVAGKTGTAKLTYKNRKGYEDGAYHSLFLGAAPVAGVEVAALVIVRRPNPKRGYYGGVVSAPAVAKILRETLAYLGVPSDKPTMVAAR